MPPTLQGPLRAADIQTAVGFLGRQWEQYHGSLQLEPDVWAILVVAAADDAENAIAQELLSGAPFAFERRESEDGAWGVYCVSGAHRATAAFWLNDTYGILSGRIRGLAPSFLPLLDDLTASPMPHRVAKSLADIHAKGEIVAGAIRRPDLVRTLLDRLHAREPLYFSAFQILLEHHLVDLIVLNRKLEHEDIELENDLTRGSVSKDPFFQARQTAASQIRNHLIRCHMINPIDQQKGAATNNPYAFMMEARLVGDLVTLRVDGIDQTLRRPDFLCALRTIRGNVYRGARLEDTNTATPWIDQTTAYPLRFLRQQMGANPGVSALDLLYMAERAVDPDGQLAP
jgi:hypothetical protein